MVITMADTGPQVLRRNTPMTENLYRSLVSNAIRRVQLHNDFTDQALADVLFCSPETVANARNQNGKLSAPTLLNLMTVDPLAIEGLLHHYGRRSVPIEAKCDTDALISTSGAVHKLAMAKAPDSPGGKAITDRECLDIEADIDAALESLSALKARCEAIRKARAA